MVGFGGSDANDEVVHVHPNSTEPLPRAPDLVFFLDQPTTEGQAYEQRVIDFSHAFARGARVLLLAGPQVGAWRETGLGEWLQRVLRLAINVAGPHRIRTLIPQLTPYFNDEMSYAVIGPEVIPNSRDLAQAITPEGDVVGRAAVRIQHENADVLIFPTRRSWRKAEEAARNILQLLPARREYPAYLDELDLGDERELRDKIQDAKRAAQLAEATLGERHRSKQILYFTDDELEREVVRFLTDELGIPARWTGGPEEEDFWLLEDKESWCIGEVKGPGTSNLGRQDVGKLDTHRKEAKRPQDFPALLVGNTFHRTQNVASRDQPIAPNVIKRAAEDHVLVVRTLDLVRLLMLGASPEAKAAFLSAIRRGGGWFEVTSDLEWHTHPMGG
jgi:hypothetical protein